MSEKRSWEVQGATSEKRENAESRVFFIRHSKATYATYSEKLGSDESETLIDLNNQPSDLPEAGIELAEKSAREFFTRFDPKQDLIYCVSSSQRRAMETAVIYIRVAEEMGFEVTSHRQGEERRNKPGENIGEDRIRVLENLSLNRERNQLHAAALNPDTHMPDINWEKIDPETREKFDRAHAIVMAGNKGSWGGNFRVHAEAVKAIFPELDTPEELYQTQYKNLIRLSEFARTQVSGEKKVNILAFGHESYIVHALEQDTGEHGIVNTEAVELNVEGKLERLTQ